jgi:hypothetical protein
MSDEQKRKISFSHLGNKREPFTIEWRKKMSESHKKLSA